MDSSSIVKTGCLSVSTIVTAFCILAVFSEPRKARVKCLLVVGVNRSFNNGCWIEICWQYLSSALFVEGGNGIATNSLFEEGLSIRL